jgi:hypothetical protein
MLPQEITALANRVLPLIAQSEDYYFYKNSGLNAQQWEALRTRLLNDGLATSLVRDALQITPEGEQVASQGPKGYIKFRENLDKQKNDSLLTNLYSRYGAIATAASTLISLLALLLPFIIGGNDNKIRELERTQVSLKAEVDSLHKHLLVLSKKQDSLSRISEKVTPLVSSKTLIPHAVLPPSNKRLLKGPAVASKQR